MSQRRPAGPPVHELIALPDLADLVEPGFLLPPAVEIVAGARSHLQVPFAHALGSRPVRLDLHLPAGPTEGPVPVVVYAHGGSFVSGMPGMGHWRTLPGHGVAVASVGYRLSEEAEFPDAAEDLRAAVRWLRDHAAELTVAPDRIGMWGSSAGGYLAGLAALSGDRPLGTPIGRSTSSARVSALVVQYAAAAPGRFAVDSPGLPAASVAAGGRVLENYLGGLPPDRTDVAAYADPADAPGVLVMHGDADRRVGVGQSVRFARQLAERGVSVELDVVPGADHADPVFDTEPHVRRVMEFLTRHWSSGPDDTDTF